MSLGYTTGFKVFEAKTTLGNREYYFHGQQTQGSSGFRANQCAGGEPSNQGSPTNTMPALANGSMKKMILSIYINGGGRLDLYSTVNGTPVLRGSGSVVPSKTTLEFDHAFLKNDLIRWENQRSSSNGTLDYNIAMEIEWDEALDNIQHWYGGLYNGLFGAGGSFWQVGFHYPNTVFPLSSRTEFQELMLKSGVILDYGMYGISPVGGDNTPVCELEINGSVVETNTLTQHAGRVFDNFEGVNVSFAKGDLIDLHAVCANNAAQLNELPTMRIQFDD